MTFSRNDETIPSNCRNRLANRIASVTLGAVVGVVGTTAVTEQQYYSAVLQSPDGDEVRIANSLDAVGMTGKRWINCVDNIGEGNEGETFMPFGKSVLQVALLDKSICDRIIDFADNPNNTALPYDQLDAIGVAAHESAHITLSESHEARVQCAAFQNLPSLAQGLGATKGKSAWMQTVYIGRYHETLPDAYKSVECTDGGLYDIDPQNVGIFPYPIPSSSNVG